MPRHESNKFLSRPAAVPNVATIVHEATHQLAYNSGLQTRYADNPLWLSEGLAMFFETPDFRSDKGWRKVGSVHPVRLRHFRKALDSRPPDRLERLLRGDAAFRDPETAGTAYAEAWSLSYYLLRNETRSVRRVHAGGCRSIARHPLHGRRASGHVPPPLWRPAYLDQDFLRFMVKLK